MPLGLLKATSRCSEGVSVVIWIGRDGSAIGSPCAEKRARDRRDAERGHVMLLAGRAYARLAVAGRDIEISAGSMRPSVLHIGRQVDRAAADERRAPNIDVVLRQIRPDAGIERDASRRLRHDGIPRAQCCPSPSAMPAKASRAKWEI